MTLSSSASHWLTAASASGLLLFAGCLGGSGQAIAPAVGPEVTVNDVTGAIVGTVTDDEIRPLVGSNLTLRKPDGTLVAYTHSDPGGAFGFSRVDPGRYNLSATAGAHVPFSQSVDVAPGAVVEVQFILPPIPLNLRWLESGVLYGNLTVGTPINIYGVGFAGFQEGVDRLTLKYPIRGKDPNGETAICTTLKIYLTSMSATALDLDLYLIGEKGGLLGRSSQGSTTNNPTGVTNEQIVYLEPLPAQNVSIIVRFFLGAQSQFKVTVQAEYAVGAAAQLVLAEAKK